MGTKPIALARLEFIFIMSMMVAVDALAIDMILPSLSAISTDFGVVAGNARQYIVTFIFIGYAIGVFIFGIVSDTFGRKKPVVVGIAVFLVGTAVCVFATSFPMFLLGRVLQGLGAAGPQVITTAIIRDCYKGRDMAEIMSLVMMVFLLVPTVAPLLGQGVLLYFSWHAIFVFLAIYAVLVLFCLTLRLPETLAIEKRTPLSFQQLSRSIKAVASNRQVQRYTLAEGLALAALLTYLSMAQQIFQEQYQLGERFPFYFGGLALVMMLASFTNSRLVSALGMRFLVWVSALVLCVLSVVFAVWIYVSLEPPSFVSFMLYAAAFVFCLGLLFGNVHSLAMEHVGEVAGVAASLIGSVSTVIATVIAVFIGSIYTGSLLPMVAGFAVLMLPIIVISVKDS